MAAAGFFSRYLSGPLPFCIVVVVAAAAAIMGISGALLIMGVFLIL